MTFPELQEASNSGRIWKYPSILQIDKEQLKIAFNVFSANVDHNLFIFSKLDAIVFLFINSLLSPFQVLIYQ